MAKKQPVHSSKPSGKQSDTIQARKSSASTPDLNVSKKILIPAIILSFIALALIYCKPLLEGQRLSTHDSNQYLAMNKESADFKEATGHPAMWSSRMFSGMPAYMIGGLELPKAVDYLPRTILYKLIRQIPDPAMDIFFLLICGFIGFYVLTKRVSYSFLGAIAIGFCTANFVSLDAGHITKVNAIAMFLPMFAGAWSIFQKRYYLGVLLFLVFSYEIIAERHVQIAYYSFILIGFYIIYEIIKAAIRRDVKHVIISGAIIGLVLTIAVMMNFDNYFINDFTKETTRGGEILNAEKMNPATNGKVEQNTKTDKGVGFDYATRWSLGYEELGALLVPNFAGGSSAAGLDENSNVYKTLTNKGVSPQQASQFVQRMPLYWGSEPFVQGPIYLGAIVLFLFVFGLFAYNGNLKWWITGGVVLTILIALGKNFEVFYRLMYDLVPMFNKFRAPTMILALTQILMVALGMLGLKDFFDDKITTKEARLKSLKYAGGITGGILIFFIVLGSAFSFQSKAVEGGQSTDDQFKAQLTQMTGDQNFSNEIYASLRKDRASFMRTDAVRSFVLVALAALLLLAFATNKFRKESYLLAGLTLLVLADFWMINKRYLNDNDFEDKEMIAANSFPQTPADAAILADNKDGARMVDFTGDVFNSASPVYYHRTIGGYNPAKLRRYQDVIEYGLSYDFQLLNKGGFQNANFVNMLNTKYIKQSNEATGIMQNPYALGNAWFVKNVTIAQTPEEEILKVREIKPGETAIVHKEFEKYLSGFMPNADSSAFSAARYIRKVETNNPMKLEYDFVSDKPEFVVFSEVIYRPNEDWKSYVDGKPAEHIRVNYILRGMKLEQGKHKITFEFVPKLLATTNNIILAGNALFYLLLLSTLFLLFKENKSKTEPVE